jgi:hypothetical protein
MQGFVAPKYMRLFLQERRTLARRSDMTCLLTTTRIDVGSSESLR